MRFALLGLPTPLTVPNPTSPRYFIGAFLRLQPRARGVPPSHPRAYSFILLLTQIKDPREANQEFRIKNSDGEGRRLDDPLVGAGIDRPQRIKNK